MARRKGQPKSKGRSTVLEVSAPPKPQPFRVDLTASAEAAYVELRRKAEAAEARGDNTSQHCTTFRMVDETIRKLIPSDPTHKRHALHKPLHEFYRIAKGRMRIVWTVAAEHRALLIVFISSEPRKDGDVRDPYEILNNMAKAGYLANIVEDWRRAMYTPPDAAVH